MSWKALLNKGALATLASVSLIAGAGGATVPLAVAQTEIVGTKDGVVEIPGHLRYQYKLDSVPVDLSIKYGPRPELEPFEGHLFEVSFTNISGADLTEAQVMIFPFASGMNGGAELPMECSRKPVGINEMQNYLFNIPAGETVTCTVNYTSSPTNEAVIFDSEWGSVYGEWVKHFNYSVSHSINGVPVTDGQASVMAREDFEYSFTLRADGNIPAHYYFENAPFVESMKDFSCSGGVEMGGEGGGSVGHVPLGYVNYLFDGETELTCKATISGIPVGEVIDGELAVRFEPRLGKRLYTDKIQVNSLPIRVESVPPAPAIDIEKYINGEDADEAPGIAVKPGEDMAIRFDVTNTGNVPLENVTVTDDKISPESITCSAATDVVTPEPTEPPATTETAPVEPTEPADIPTSTEATPTETVTGAAASLVRNSGSLLTDPQRKAAAGEPGANGVVGHMEPGQVATCVATLAGPADGELHKNTGTVTGDFGEEEVTDSDDAHATGETPAPETTESVTEETVTPTPTTEPTPVTETQVVTTTVSGTPVTETVVVTKEPEPVHVTDTVKVTEEVVTVKDGVTTTETVVRDVPASVAPTEAPAPVPKRVALAVTGTNAGTISTLSLALLTLAGLAFTLRRKA